MKQGIYLSVFVFLLCTSIFTIAAVDVKFTTNITMTPDPAVAGDTVTFNVSFKPVGGAVDNFKIIGGVDGVTIFTRTFAHINADAQRTGSFTWTATIGSHTVWFELDPGHTQGDSNYGNNRIEKAITIGGGSSGQPDLVPIVIYSPGKFKANDEVEFSIIIYNKGDKISKLCDMQVIQNGSVIDTKIVPTVLPVSSNVSNNHWHITYKWKAVCGAVIEFKLDSNNVNAESNEGNNSWSGTMSCSFTILDVGPGVFHPVAKEDPNGPDLTVKIIKIYKSPYDSTGKTATVEFEVANIGKAKSVPCNMTAKRGGVDEMYFDVPALEAGQKYSDKFGEEYVCGQETTMHIDTNNKNIESKEDNNVARKKIVCL